MYVAILAIFTPVLGTRVATLLPTLATLLPDQGGRRGPPDCLTQ